MLFCGTLWWGRASGLGLALLFFLGQMQRKLRNLFDHYDKQEDRITHALLVVLAENPTLLKSILRQYNIKVGSSQLKLLTQAAPRKSKGQDTRPDGYIYSDDYSFCMGIETKIAPNALNQKQISGHLKQLSEYDESILVLLTPDEKPPDMLSKIKQGYNRIRFISWPDLLAAMIKIGPDRKNKVGEFLFDKFFSYMERNYQMTPFTGFKFEDGYDIKLAAHYVKRVSSIITPDIRKMFPKCSKTRPKIGAGSGYPWQAWYSTDPVQSSLHPSLSVQPHQIRCEIILANGCKKEWRLFKSILKNPHLGRKFKSYLRHVYKEAPAGGESVLSFRQRHYKARTKAVHDAETVLNIAVLLGIDKSKKNIIWWDLLEKIVATKNRYNYQLEIGYDLKYEVVRDLNGPKAINTLKKCYENLRPIFNFIKNPV